jgi:hypothetical protein
MHEIKVFRVQLFTGRYDHKRLDILQNSSNMQLYMEAKLKTIVCHKIHRKRKYHDHRCFISFIIINAKEIERVDSEEGHIL